MKKLVLALTMLAFPVLLITSTSVNAEVLNPEEREVIYNGNHVVGTYGRFEGMVAYYAYCGAGSSTATKSTSEERVSSKKYQSRSEAVHAIQMGCK